MAELQIKELLSVMRARSIDGPNALLVHVLMTDEQGMEVEEHRHLYRPEDPYGINPMIKKALEANHVDPLPYREPDLTIQEQREQMPSLEPRQLRQGLIKINVMPSAVTAQLEALPAGPERESLLTDWEYGTYYTRLQPFISALAGVMGLSEGKVDELWGLAAAI